MKKLKKIIFPHVINVITIALIVECFLCSFLAVRLYAKDDCYDRMKETTTQTAAVLNHAIKDSTEELTLFADIIAANSSNPDELLLTYMENFCKTQNFTAVCIHKKDGTTVTYGRVFHDAALHSDVESETPFAPYVSEIIQTGDSDEDKVFYQAVPVIRNGKLVATLYGYMPITELPRLVSCTAYEGNCEICIVDGDSGDFLMDTRYADQPLGNIYDGSKEDTATKEGYDADDMRNDIRMGKSGYYVFLSKTEGEWFYTYYMPVGVNNWSIQLTIDEPTAHAGYNDVITTVLVLAICVVVLMMTHVLVLMRQTSNAKKKDLAGLEKSNYMYEVQKALLNAHNNADYIEQALKTVANEMTAETVMLLTFADRTVTNAYYWPSKDRSQAMNMVGRNIRDDFPVLFDILRENKSVVYASENTSMELSETAKDIFRIFDVTNIMLVPIMDNANLLKGCICAVNMAEKKSNEMLECVIYDFFMAITNIETHNIIKNMGAMDYLTNIKNRNSYESEIQSLVTLPCDSLWCVFIDANGLHEINNTQGHKAGDIMLCTVAASLKKQFGSKYTYRLGGDEFVAFAPDSKQEEILKKKKLIMAELAAKGYSVSIGFEGIQKNENDLFDVDCVVAEAEAIMYREKWEYYKKNDLSSERGHFPKHGMTDAKKN